MYVFTQVFKRLLFPLGPQFLQDTLKLYVIFFVNLVFRMPGLFVAIFVVDLHNFIFGLCIPVMILSTSDY